MGMMRQLFENLISNSLKYAREDVRPVIEITNHQEQDQLKIAIKDNGIGFDEKYLSKMFNLFQRLHTDQKYKGTGLGLAICKKIVTLHHGEITAHSKINEGATFEITIPLKQLN
jgi:signal transduction histidine kinase